MNQTVLTLIRIAGIFGFVVSIFAILFSFIPCIGVYAFVFGIVGFSQSLLAYIILKIQKESSGLYLAGSVVGFVAIVVSVAQIFIFAPVLEAADDIGKHIDEAMEEAALDLIEETLEDIPEEAVDTTETEEQDTTAYDDVRKILDDSARSVQ